MAEDTSFLSKTVIFTGKKASFVEATRGVVFVQPKLDLLRTRKSRKTTLILGGKICYNVLQRLKQRGMNCENKIAQTIGEKIFVTNVEISCLPSAEKFEKCRHVLILFQV